MNSIKRGCVLAVAAVGGLWWTGVTAQVTPTLDADTSDRAGVSQLQSVTLGGTNLQQFGFTTTVSFNGTPVPPSDVLSLSPERVVVLVPAGFSPPVERVSVVVAVDGESTDPLDFDVVTDAPLADDEVLVRPMNGAFIGMISGLADLLITGAIPLDTAIWWRLQIQDGGSIAQAIADLFATGLVASAEAVLPVQEDANGGKLPSKQTVEVPPNDPRFAEQYGPQRIRAVDNTDQLDAFAISKADDTSIAIVDTGVDATHEDLVGNKMVAGWDFVDGDNDPNDGGSHGTHVAGTAGAYTDNNKGIVGIAPNADLIAERVLGPTGGKNEWVAAGIKHAAGLGADVINLSLGSTAPSKLIRDAVFGAIGQGVVVVASSGNNGEKGDPPGYPAAFSHPSAPDGLIAAANSNASDRIHSTSTKGSYVDVAAPGTDILASIPGNDYGLKTGTSMAAPHASGLAALMLGAARMLYGAELTPTQIECLMEITAVDIEEEDFDIKSGHGRIDAYAAVHSVMSLATDFHLLPPECNTWRPSSFPTLDPREDEDGDGDIDLPPVLAIPGVLPGQGHPDQVIPITTDNAIALAAALESTAGAGDHTTLRIDIPGDVLATEYPGVPISDSVLTPDDQYGLVVERMDRVPFARVLRIRLADDSTAPVSVHTPVTELTVTPDSEQALLGTVRDLVVIDVATPGSDSLDINAITAASVTPDSADGLVGEPNGVQVIELDQDPPSATLLETTGIPITGPVVTSDGARAVVGTPTGVAIIDPAGPSVVATVASGVPATNIALTPSDAFAVYATTDPVDGTELIRINIATASSLSRSLAALPVTDIHITSDSARAVVGTQDGISVVSLVTGTVDPVPAPGGEPLRTGLSLYPDDSWATVGIAPGVWCVDPVTLAAKIVTTTTMPLTNVSIAPDNSIGVIGIESGVALADCKEDPVQPADEIGMAQPVIAATVTPDGTKAVIGTLAGFHVLNLGTESQVQVSPKPPVLNWLPDDTQPPLNPLGERGRPGPADG